MSANITFKQVSNLIVQTDSEIVAVQQSLAIRPIQRVIWKNLQKTTLFSGTYTQCLDLERFRHIVAIVASVINILPTTVTSLNHTGD